VVRSEGEVIDIDPAAANGAVVDGYAVPTGDALGLVAQVRRR